MNKKILSSMMFGAALLLFAACTQDEVVDSDTLPEGQYPLEIASVTLSVEGGEAQPWGAKVQTRVSESTDGSSSVWETGDEFYVKFEGWEQVGTYRITDASAGTVEAVTPAYWTSTNSGQTIIAWYASPEGTDGTVSLADQSNGLAYVLQANTTADFNTTASLTFTHSLAKVRLKTTSSSLEDYPVEEEVTSVRIKSYTTCVHTQGDDPTGFEEGWITMQKATYDDETYWEANVVPNHPITEFQVNGNNGTLDDNGITPEVGKINTITVMTVAPENTTGTYSVMRCSMRIGNP